MKKIYDEVTITQWNRWEDPGDYPNNIATRPLPPGPWYPEETKGHALYEMTEEDWDRLEELDEPREIADFFEMNPINTEGYQKSNLAVIEAEYTEITIDNCHYAVVIPIKFGEYICGPDLSQEVMKAEMTLRALEQKGVRRW